MKQPLHQAELEWEVFGAGTSQEVRYKALCDVGGRAKLGVALMELPPRSDTSPAHWHMLENTGSEPFRYLMIGERIAGDQVHR